MKTKVLLSTRLNYNTIFFVSFQDEWFRQNHSGKKLIDSSQTAGFDADSEGSDNETAPNLPSSKLVAQNSAYQVDHQQIIAMDTTTTPDCNGNSSYNDDSIAVNELDHCVTTTPVKSGAIKRTRQPDASKFNRSNRKSKNCAIFYFKHLDTDGENKDWSSQASEASEVHHFVHSNNFDLILIQLIVSRPSNQLHHQTMNGYIRIVTIRTTMRIQMTLALIPLYL